MGEENLTWETELRIRSSVTVSENTELDEIKRLKEELRRLKIQLSDEILDHKIDEAALQIACSKLGITPEELKKKSAEK